MLSYIIKRIAWFPITIILVGLVAFFLSKAVPYDPVDAVLNLEQGEAMIEDQSSVLSERYIETAKRLGLDKAPFYLSINAAQTRLPSGTILAEHQKHNYSLLIKKGFTSEQAIENTTLTYEEIESLDNQFSFRFPSLKWHGIDNQFHVWISNFFKGDFGTSYLDGRQVSDKIMEALKWTIFMVLLAISLAFLLGIFIGYLNEIKPEAKWLKYLNTFNYFIYAIPLFWFATLALVFLTTDDYGKWTNIFPSIKVFIDEGQGFWHSLGDYGALLILPIILMSLNSLSYISKQMFTSLQNESSKLYAKTAKIKGLQEDEIVQKHTMRNALLPMVTLFTSALPASIAGSVVIETIFNIPGMGRLLFDSIGQADWNVVFAIVLMTAILTTVSFLLADILYFFLNPKMKLKS